MEKLIIPLFGFLFAYRCIIVYLRSGLKGELIRSVGDIILIIAILSDDIPLSAIGYIIFGIGLITLFTIENETWKEIFGTVTVYERIIGNIPKFLDKNESRKASKAIVIAIVILALITAFEYYRIKLNYFEGLVNRTIADFVEFGILMFAAILLVGNYLFKTAE